MKKILLIGVAVLCATSAMAAKDNFNRTSLGSNWTVPYPTLSISNDQLVGTSEALGYDTQSGNDNQAKAIVYLNSTDVEYGAVAIGDVANGTNAFVKIQDSTGIGEFDYGAFYTGNNGGGDYFALDSAVPSPATLTVTFCGTTAVMKIKSSAGTQKYRYDYGTSVGTGGGLGTYGDVSLDNYKSKNTGCTDAEGAKWVTPSSQKDPTLSK
jgi:hypothetical protein